MAARLGYLLWKRSQDQGDLGNTDGDTSGQFGGMSTSDSYSDGDDDGYEGYDSWWWSPTGMAVRYTIIVILFASLLLFFLGGYYHAQRRLRKGLPPLPYHAWMVRRRYHPDVPFYQNRQGPYQMNGYQQPPPPAYNAYSYPPPAYSPPEGGTKVMANQHVQAETSGESSVAPPAPAAAPAAAPRQ